jgi:hypothetical protein
MYRHVSLHLRECDLTDEGFYSCQESDILQRVTPRPSSRLPDGSRRCMSYAASEVVLVDQCKKVAVVLHYETYPTGTRAYAFCFAHQHQELYVPSATIIPSGWATRYKHLRSYEAQSVVWGRFDQHVLLRVPMEDYPEYYEPPDPEWPKPLHTKLTAYSPGSGGNGVGGGVGGSADDSAGEDLTRTTAYRRTDSKTRI